jgi:hypothetical protein
VEEKNPNSPIRAAYPNITIAAREGLTQAPFCHKDPAEPWDPRFGKRYMKERKARIAESQKGKNPGPGWRRPPKPIRKARAAAPTPKKIKKEAVHLSQRRMEKLLKEEY